MSIHARCPICKKLIKLPKHPLGGGFYCGNCGYMFFKAEQYRNKELKRLKEHANE